MNNTKLQSKLERRVQRGFLWLREHNLGYGALTMLCILAALSALSAVTFSPSVQFFLENEVATSDVVADHSFLVEDATATRSRQQQVRSSLPLICDLTPESFTTLQQRVQGFFTTLNASKTQEEREKLRTALMEETGEDFPSRLFHLFGQEDLQQLVTQQILPWLEPRLLEGVISDSRLLLQHKGGVMVRNLRDGTEVLYTDTQAIPDLKTLLADLAAMLRLLPQSSPQAKRAALALMEPLVTPTLSPNYEATKTRTEEALRALGPVVHQVQKGEIIVRQGERVNKEQQLKLQSLRQRKSDRFRHTVFLGTFVCSLILASGLFFSPSGRPSSPVRQKDLVFIGVLVASTALLAKALALLGQKLMETNPSFSADSLVFALPVAGIAGLSALIFSTRRYLVTGLLLAFFCSAMNKASLPIFLFYFLSAMWNTWLIVRTQTRQDVVVSILPLMLGLFGMWIGATFMQGGPHTRYLPEAIAVFSSGILSMLLIFALAPCMEMIFGYSTRFRLMELMNLDQPILRELMLNAPGTYHHSLITSHLVEAGAKAIGAQSLLCKVAALYHDVGKVTRPEYFIENQFGGENPHDRLAPSMSALILTSHVKKGVELAQAHRLGHEVIDIIRQHHGSATIAYFYQKAVDLGENPRKADYSYSGPKPQTREAAITMLADAVEASSRVLDNPTPSRLQAHIDTIIKSVFATGQLDESELTFKDLDLLTHSFLRVLTGLFHHRIKYPDKVPVKPVLQAEIDRLRNVPKTKGENCAAVAEDRSKGADPAKAPEAPLQ